MKSKEAVTHILRKVPALILIAGALHIASWADWGSIRENNRFHEEHRQAVKRSILEHRLDEHRIAERARALHHLDRDIEGDELEGQFWSSALAGAEVHALPAGRISLIVGGSPYYYYDGVFYQSNPSGFAVVIAPAGAVVPSLPSGAVASAVGNATYYYAGGAYYVAQGQSYAVVPPPVGITVTTLPPGATPISTARGLAYLAGGVYYLPTMQGGLTVYTTAGL
ncbi:MAG TPA: DUF6515 family protein [Verrucomicrobiae bacterium]|jgi:hypothetical protein|nr:DUF6515 family protein [Verrucomicrobiae bacterium]